MFGLTQLVERAALVNAGGVACHFQGRDTRWSELRERIARTAGVLRGLGVRDGDRVAIISANSDFYCQYLFAVAWAGGVITPVNARLTAPEALYWLQDSGATIVFVDAPFVELIERIRSQLGSQVHAFVYVGADAAPAGYHDLAALLATTQPVPDAGRQGDDLYAIYYTGGTTGRSKGVMLTHGGLLVNVMQWTMTIGVTGVDRMLIVAPMFHMVAALNCIVAALIAGSAVILPRFDAELVLRTIAEQRVTKAALVPAMLDSLVSSPDARRWDLSSLKRISYGGAPMPESLLRRALELLPQTRFFQIYGQTEGGPNISCLAPEDHVLSGPGTEHLRSAGKPLPAVDVGIFDENGNRLALGQRGEICVRSPGLSPGYWNKPEETRAARRGDWLRTGDVGYFDAGGFLYIVDRLKDMIVTGGVNVYSAEVENALHAHPAVAECAVIGVPDARWGERVHAIVRLVEGAQCPAEQLMAHCRTLLADFKRPRSIDIVTQPLPRSAANKILKQELRAPFWRDQARKV
ncbi:MAG: long-chain-fatty-acid--CoA ligase [Steroidobacteraceae bacterium]